jgi:carbonic anhydrase/acetyltransferase-like protein (isoleucine patch superfamily)
LFCLQKQIFETGYICIADHQNCYCATNVRFFVGSCAFVTPEIVIGNRCRIMAGAGVYRDCKDDTLISGNPAKSHEMK